MAWFLRVTKSAIQPDERLLVSCASRKEARHVCSVLDMNGVPYRCVKLGNDLHVLEFGNTLRRSIQVLVKAVDLARARKLLEELQPPRAGASR